MTQFHLRLLLHICLLVLLVVSTSLHAVPYAGEEFTYYQPDGAAFPVKLYGDEFYAVAETADGYVVTRDPETRAWCYAALSLDSNAFTSTGVRVGTQRLAAIARGARPHLRINGNARMAVVRARQQEFGVDERGRPLPAYAPGDVQILRAPTVETTGKRVGLVLLVAFPDRPGDVTISQADVDAYCNEPGFARWSNHGSVYDYYAAQSQGHLSYNCVVSAYYTALNPRSYYTDPNIAYGSRARELIIEALEALAAQGFDFSQCDANGDSRIDGCNCFYAGNRVNAWSEGLWPHKSSLYWSGAPPPISGSMYYQITDMTAQLRLGTFCHENGHMLCSFPDLYDYGYESYGAGNYSLMAYYRSSTAPVNVDAYLKMKAGWCDVIDIQPGDHFRGALRVDSNTIYRYPHPWRGQEYFVIGLRHNYSGYERVAPDQGLIVWHVDEYASNNNEQMTEGQHFEASVEQADGLAQLEYKQSYGGAGDLFHAGDRDAFDDVAVPDAHWWSNATGGTNGSGDGSGLYLHSISAVGPMMTFIVGDGTLTGGPKIGRDEFLMTPRCDVGSDAAAAAVGIWNMGAGILNYGIASDSPWLSCSLSNGTLTTEGDVVTINYSTHMLAPGAHTGIVTITAGAANSPQSITNVLTVNSPAMLALSTTSLTQTVAFGSNAAPRSFTIGNTGESTLRYTLDSTAAWLSASPTSGTVAGEVDTIYVETASAALPAGIYTGMVTISSADATNSPQGVSVTLAVTPEPSAMALLGTVLAILRRKLGGAATHGRE